jgi:hypothetical protein
MGKIVYPGRSIYADCKRWHIQAEAAENNALKNLTPPNSGVFLLKNLYSLNKIC